MICEPFLGLHETLQTREQEHTALLDRGPKHHGRTLAHERFRNAKVALENFLISIEAPNEAIFDVAQADFATRADPTQPARTDNTAEGPRPHINRRDSREESPQVEQITPTELSPIAKRRLERDSGAKSLERKRIKFTESVEERPEYRSFYEFFRGGKEYIPGRYVVAEGSEYLDTSGSTLSFTKFTGQRKVGSKFVDVVPKEEPQEGEDNVLTVKSKGTGNRKRKQDREAFEDRRKHLEHSDSMPEYERDNDGMNGRELRSTRRSRSTTPSVMTRSRREVAQYDGQDDKAQNIVHVNRSLIVSLKTPYLFRDDVPADEQGSMHTPEHGEEDQDISREGDRAEATRDAAELTRINQVVENLERELNGLQQAVATPKYTHKVSTAVRGALEALAPLKKLLETRPVDTEKDGESEGDIEDGSIYFDVVDATDKVVSEDMLHSAEALEKLEHSQTRADTASHIGAGEVYESFTPDANGLDDMPMEVGQNMHTTPAAETAEPEDEHTPQHAVLSVEAGLEKTSKSITDEGATVTSTTTKCGSSEPSRHIFRVT
ncbi:uncharacterized protein EKO05_0004368 [Ascochyta rabiei]|uniref:uncharacterized protein n=1 Tax=Didymella rabiei TaxID=5454 RepID=UPI0021FD70F0|nr:uncharacterized protein EKO05_0004368 [Ascochyta rabiei]UPX13871.1 hypothetical protein EKO05_0004368 [Ascochyta rabiei]